MEIIRTRTQIAEDFINRHKDEIKSEESMTAFRGFIHESLYAYDVNCDGEKNYDDFLEDLAKSVWKPYFSQAMEELVCIKEKVQKIYEKENERGL